MKLWQLIKPIPLIGSLSLSLLCFAAEGGTQTPASTFTQLAEIGSSVPFPEGTQRVSIREIRAIGSTVFEPEDLSAIVQLGERREFTGEQMAAIGDRITQRYIDNGYITSQAVTREDPIVDGVLIIDVIEGTIARVEIDEKAGKLARYVRDRLSSANHQPFNQIDFENQLQLLQADPLIESITAGIRAAENEGESYLIVRAVPAPSFSGRAVIDTNSPPSVGTVRMGLESTYRNPLGLGDSLDVSAYRTTTGGSESYGIRYQVPLNTMNGTLQARYSPSSFNLTTPALSSLNIEGSAQTYELSFRQPVIRTPQEEFALWLNFRHRTGETLLSNIVIDDTRTSVVQIGQDYLRRDRTGAWGIRSQVNWGTNLLNATDRNNQADGQFLSWSGQIQRAQRLNRKQILIMQGSFQFANDSLLGADQFIIGGPTSVRGYDQNARFGDNGLRASIEDRITVSENEDGTPFAQIIPFIDTATVWNQDRATNDQTLLLGAGIGTIIRPSDSLQARVDIAVPLIRLDEAGDSAQDLFVYFNMDYRF